MGRFETEWLASEENLAALADLSGKLSAADIRRLNYAVDAQHQDAAAVVRAFRQSRGF